MKILVTGAEGYLGSAIMRLAPEAKGLTRKDVDLENAGETTHLLSITEPDAVIHCAARWRQDAFNDAAAASASFVMAENVIAGDHKVVFASSMTVYARNYQGISMYALSKLACESLLGEFDVSVRLPGIFGAPRRAGLLYNAARTFLHGQEFRVHPAALWSPLHIESAARFCLEATDMAGTYDVGYPGLPDIDDALDLLWNLCGERGSFHTAGSPRYQPEQFTAVGNLERDLESFVEWVKSEL